MVLIKRDSDLWSYVPEEIRGLIEDGEIVVEFVEKYREKEEISDYSFMVFPFAKAYEGFLKKFLLDAKLIQPEDYYSDDIRIGRILNPRYEHETHNVFKRICDHSHEGNRVSQQLWGAWKAGRNLVFHYFPHNFRRLSYDDALGLIRDVIGAMEVAISHCRV